MKVITAFLIIFVLCMAVVAPAFAALSDGLIAYYPFNGNANDESGNGNDGIVHNARKANDRFGNEHRAYYFDGKTSFIKVKVRNNSAFNIAESGFTVTGWFKASSVQHDPTGVFTIVDKSHGDNGIYNDYAGWVVESYSFGNYGTAFAVGNGSGWTGVTTDTNTLDDQWHHFAASYDGATVKIYLDGILKNTLPFDGVPAGNDRPLFIGKHYALGRYFHGFIDEIRIYNRTLSECEISAMM